jgi:hypothetical protein
MSLGMILGWVRASHNIYRADNCQRYSARRNLYSDKARNTKYELSCVILSSIQSSQCNLLISQFASVLLEKWHGELPELLRVSYATLRGHSVNHGAPSTTLPHVLVMNMMFHFAVILLNRFDYCNTSTPSRATTETQSSTITITATEKCNQAA